MWKLAYIIHSYLHLIPVAKGTLTIWSRNNEKLCLIWIKYDLFCHLNILNICMVWIHIFHKIVYSFQSHPNLKLTCTTTYAVKVIQNEIWKKLEVTELKWWFAARWLWLYSPEYTCQPFLPSDNLPLNLINKDEFLSIMKFTLNHKFVNGHYERSGNKRRFCFRKKRDCLISLLCPTWGCYTTALLKSMEPSILFDQYVSRATNMLGVLHDDLCTNQSNNSLCLKSKVCKSGEESVFSM